MPQFDISTYFTQIFWLLTTFVCFWFVLDKIIIPRIAENIEARKRKYNDLILKAEQISKKARATLAEYNETITAAKNNALEQIKENEKQLQEYIIKQEDELNKKFQKKIIEFEQQIKIDRDNALNRVDEISRELALKTLHQLNIKDITIEDVNKITLLEDKKDVI